MQVSTCWTQAATPEDSLEFLRTLSMWHARRSGAQGVPLVELFRKRNYRDILSFETDYTDTATSVEQYRHLRQALGLITKLEFLDVGIDKEAVAIETFLKAEARCLSTNEVFRKINEGGYFLTPPYNAVLYSAKEQIRKILGKAPRIGELPLAFGPGATTSIKRSQACPTAKMAEAPRCSASLVAAGLLPEVVRSLPEWFANHEREYYIDDEGWLTSRVEFEVCPGKLEFVPKNAKTHRIIDKQPTVNSVVQAGIGKSMMRLLFAAGLDLTSTDVNQALARKGSLDDSIATIDLSSASDLIAREFVRFLLPEDWFTLLYAAGCHSTMLRGRQLSLNKFSSMGNGYTFPLESLIFWALARATCKNRCKPLHEVNVYGDDIVLPSVCYGELVDVLDVCGFIVNTDKSFKSGPFRESCGKDYYLGFDIRPFYQKHLVSGRTQFVAYNNYARKGWFAEGGEFGPGPLAMIKRSIPSSLRLYGPDGYGDGHLLSEEFRRSYKKRANGYCGYTFDTLSLVGRKVKTPYPGDWVTPLYSIYTKGRDFDPLDVGDVVQEFAKDGRMVITLPGTDEAGEYVRRSIYTFG